MTPRRIFCSVFIAASVLAATGTSKWVYLGPDQKLHYRTDDRGNRIMDFSFAGYRGGGVQLPAVPAARTLSPGPGDNGPQIQSAINAVAMLPQNKDGFRGAVLLKPGLYEVGSTLTIAASGVVLRGSGSGEGGTTIQLIGPPHRFLDIRGTGGWTTGENFARVTDSYVPSGADSFHVDRVLGLHVGDTVLVRRPVTEAWIHFMHMDSLVRDGKAQTWLKAGSFIHTDRVIRSIAGTRITLDVPLSDSIDSQFLKPPGATIVRYSFARRVADVGLESLRIAAPTQDAPITDRQYSVLLMDAVIDGWARDIAIQETQNAIVVGGSAKRITLDSVRIVHTVPHSGAAAPADFSLAGTQVLVNRCSVQGEGTWPVVTQASVTGPIVVLNFESNERGIAPHQRWATGLLVDSSRLANSTDRTPGIAFSNRKTAGSGHGWDIGWAVAWNVTSPFLLVQQPPGAMNWCIGCNGKPVSSDMPAGVFDSPDVPVAPASLYLEQLRERLGDRALADIGYDRMP